MRIMKQFTLFIITGMLIFSGFMFTKVNAQVDNHTAREEADGKVIWEKFQNKEFKCEDLSDEDFGSLGEYFMGQMVGEQHQAMNNMMIQMMGEESEEEMHVAMGKRMSDCEPNASIPQDMMGGGIMPTIKMMGGGNSMMGNFATTPMSWFGWSFGWIFMILFWGLIILGIIGLIKLIMNQGGREIQNKSALDIIKERYAKGEIDKKEFEKKKNDLS